jgi:hypothetical protein
MRSYLSRLAGFLSRDLGSSRMLFSARHLRQGERARQESVIFKYQSVSILTEETYIFATTEGNTYQV